MTPITPSVKPFIEVRTLRIRVANLRSLRRGRQLARFPGGKAVSDRFSDPT